MIRTENLTKKYNGVNAVNELNLEVKDGDIFGFLGPNGAGKSTTILMLTGMIEPTSGKCFINDIEVSKDPIGVKNIIGYLPEDVGFYSHMTAQENLDYFARFYDIDRAARKKRIDEVLELVNLGGVIKKAGQFSRGMNQRLGMAQALINDPQILFLDEPTANLDPESVFQYRNLVKRLSKEGKTIFIVSHILPEVSNVCKTIGIIKKGQLISKGTIDELKKEFNDVGENQIIVEAYDSIPDLTHADIVKIEYSDDRKKVVIEVSSDIREYISNILFEKQIRVKEIKIDEPTLEEAFLSIYKE
jgi:ABC-2 type transport system ATP-binding protein